MTALEQPVGWPAPPHDLFLQLVAWQRQHGRHGLPWQGTRDPYRVWLSEIMLQQTQVSTVLAYYPRFLARFPDVHALASASLDEVLALWSGLGYYSRARHLHRCAQQVVQQWGGQFPRDCDDLARLSGIGPSTAAAIAAFCFGQSVSILDGNVRRVLSRWAAFEADLASARHERQLWALAQSLLPPQPQPDDMAHYTQGLMDLGATVCTRTRPQCTRCPWSGSCLAHAQGRELSFPVKTKRLLRRTEAWWWLVLQRPDGACWLQQRPASGIWAGLYGFPTFSSHPAMHSACLVLGAHPEDAQAQAPIAHALTHRDWVLHPYVLPWPAQASHAPFADAGAGLWVQPHTLADATPAVGMPSPVRAFLTQMIR